MKLYTKTGDKGKTGLFGGDRVKKDHIRIETYGQVDELNAVIGVALAHKTDQKLDSMLEFIQQTLFNLGSDLATPLDSKFSDKVKRISLSQIEELEKWIDELQSLVAPFTNFILPGGSEASAYLHLARTVCRRAERTCVRLMDYESIGDNPQIYLNRLSDFLFIAARYANKVLNVEDIEWNTK